MNDFFILIRLLNQKSNIMSHEKAKQQEKVKKKATKTLKEKRIAKKAKKADKK